jgi:hypothetical protein
VVKDNTLKLPPDPLTEPQARAVAAALNALEVAS